MAVRIIKKSWWIDFRFGHTRYRKRSPENSRAGAQAYEAVLRQKLARGGNIEADGAKAEDQSFEEFAWRWFEDYVIPNNRPSTQRDKKAVLIAGLIPFFGRLKLSEITTHRVEQFKAQQARRGVTNVTINSCLAKLQTCLNVAYEWGVLEIPPPRVKRLKCPPGRTDFLSLGETRTLVELAKPELRELLVTTLRTGLRQGELRALQWSSIDWDNRSLIVRHTLSPISNELWAPKNNRERRIPLDTEVHEMLLKRRKVTGFVFAQRSGRPIGGSSLNARLARLCRRANLRKITWHALRHTFATHLAMSGAPLVTIQALLGHSSITMTTRYAHAAPSSLREAIERLNTKPGLPAAWATGGQPATGSAPNRLAAQDAFAKAA